MVWDLDRKKRKPGLDGSFKTSSVGIRSQTLFLPFFCDNPLEIGRRLLTYK